MKTKKASKLRALSVGLIALLALVLSGCMRTHYTLELHPNDTVSGEMVVAIQDSALTSLGMDPREYWDEQMAEAPDTPGMMVEPYAQDGYTGSKFTFDALPISQFDSGGQTGNFSFTRDGDEFVVSGSFDLSADSDLGVTDADMLQGFDVFVQVTFPGPVSDHNGMLNGNTVIWQPKIGEKTDIMARGSAVPGVATPPTTPTTPTDTPTTPTDTPTTPTDTPTTPTDQPSDGGVAVPTTPSDPNQRDDGGFPWLWVLVGAGGGLLLIGALTALLVSRKKKGQAQGFNQPGYGSAYGAPYGQQDHSQGGYYQPGPGQYPGPQPGWGQQTPPQQNYDPNAYGQGGYGQQNYPPNQGGGNWDGGQNPPNWPNS